jgi:hypothetical protein
MLDKPLHVQVAEALGWSDGNPPLHLQKMNDHGWVEDAKGYFGSPPDGTVDAEGRRIVMMHVPSYDTDWSATGPLIEKWRFHGDVRLDPTCHAPDWCAFYIPEGEGDIIESAKHPTLLIAVCNLILALKEAGKL